MKRDKLKLYIYEIILIAFLFFALFASNIINRITLSIVLLIFAFVANLLFKKRTINSIYEKQVTISMVICAGVYLIILYLLGLYFDFVKPKIGLSLWSIINFIIPLSIAVVSSEIIRKKLLSQPAQIKIKNHKLNISLILIYISTVLIDLSIYTEVYNLTNLDDFLKALGYVLFASLSCNLLYNYISNRFNYKGIIIYRLITILYIYILPVIPDMYIFFQSFYRMLFPYLIYIFLEKNFGQKLFTNTYVEKRNNIVGNTVLIVVMTLIIMLISCQFKYGMLVIGSESMTGTLNKGDAIIYEEYKNQEIELGKIIIFDYNGLQTIHRVIDIKNINGEKRYYTQGDANKDPDAGYRTEKEIIGVIDLKIKHIGYPTLWLRSIFK